QHAQPPIGGGGAVEPALELGELGGAADEVAAALEARAVALVEAARPDHLDDAAAAGDAAPGGELAQRVQAAGEPSHAADKQQTIGHNVAHEGTNLVDHILQNTQTYI